MRDIPGYESLYAITEDGQVWSYPKPPRNPSGMWMRQQLIVNKYRRLKSHSSFQVSLCRKGGAKRFLVHRLVALAYIPNPDGKPDINHKDGNPLNNYVSNLEWCTKFENMQHAMQNGLLDIHSGRQDETRRANGRKTGALNGMRHRRMFTMKQAERIRELHREGKSRHGIASMMGCSDKTIGNIVNGQSYMVAV